MIKGKANAFDHLIDRLLSVLFFCTIAPSIELLIIFRFIQGVSGAGGMVISRAIVRDLYSGSELTKFFATIDADQWGRTYFGTSHWWTASAVYLLAGRFYCFRYSRNADDIRSDLLASRKLFHRKPDCWGIKEYILTLKSLLKDRIFMGYVFTQGFVTAAMFAYISGSPFVIQNIYGASPQMFSFIFAINGLGIIIAGQTAGRLAGRVEETTLLKIGLCTASIWRTVTAYDAFIRSRAFRCASLLILCCIKCWDCREFCFFFSDGKSREIGW